MASTERRSRLRAWFVLTGLIAVVAAGCGARPAAPAATAVPDVAPRATSAAATIAPVPGTVAPATATPAPVATAAETLATPAPAGPTPRVTTRPDTTKPDAPEGSLRLVLTAPMDVDVTVPANVDCTVGRSYHMFAGVEVEGESVELTVDVAVYHGPDDYRALVRVMASSPEGTQGGEIPGVPVTITSDTNGRADFEYSGANGSVSGKVVWSCSP